MIYRKPNYFDNFQCIAGDCQDTCCSGWQIVIDDDSLEKYKNYRHENNDFIKRLQNSIDWEEGCYKQDDKRRCAMLREDGLCDQVLALSEASLCNTCHLYPRHVEEYEGIREWMLSLSCPVAAHMVLSNVDKTEFIETCDDMEDPLEEEFEDFDFFLYTQLEDAEKLILDFLQNREIPSEVRVRSLLGIGKKLQELYDEDGIGEIAFATEQFTIHNAKKTKDEEVVTLFHLPIEDKLENAKLGVELLKNLGILNEDWAEHLYLFEHFIRVIKDDYNIRRETFDQFLTNNKNAEFDIDIFRENFLVTMTYTWLKGAVYSGEIYAKLALVVFTETMIEEFMFYQCEDCGESNEWESWENMTRRLLREIEHSQENLIMLEEELMNIYFEI